MKRFKINFAVVAFLLGSFIAVTQSSFTAAKPANAKFAGTNYVFNGNALADDTDPDNYSMESGDPGCDNVTDLPCVINVPDGTSLSDWLGARTEEQIRDQATHKKSIE